MPAALIAALVLQATPETLAELDRAYDQACNGRLYGQVDNMCNDMAEQVKRYRAELKRRPRPAKAEPPAAPSPSPPAEPLPSQGLSPPAPKG